MKRALLILDVPLPPAAILRPRLRAAGYVVAVDGGADRARRAGVRPHAIVGDFDSVRPATLARFPPERVFEDADPNTTDLDKAIRHVRGRGYGHITIVGSNRDRLDHTLGNLALLLSHGRRAHLELVDEHFTTTIVTRSAPIRGPPGTVVSLVAPQGARGVTTRGLRWELQGFDLPFGTRGIHNEIRRSPARVSVRRGPLLLMVGHRVLRHR